ncbi:MAG: D-alanyl-D-alanine carboxypeptidase [Candidatus Taylorbacteria bacterium]|nr:D-alanyl-D-alanine carboxypeptidase [Candidatus Taylorbacteria bacterium]
MRNSQPQKEKNKFTLAGTVLGLAGIVLITVLLLLGNDLNSSKFSLPEEESTAVALSPFRNLQLSARSAYVYDMKGKKEIFSRNGSAQLPLASLTKVMMAITALSLLPDTTVVNINPSFLLTEGDSGLYSNESWQLKDLLNLTLVESSNDGANAIASVAGAFGKPDVSEKIGRQQFVEAMNKKAIELNLAQTYFLNPTGLDENVNVSGAYGSAHDMSILFSNAITKYPELFGSTSYHERVFTSLSNLKHVVKNTNTFVGNIPSLLGSKTGYTDLAGGNLVIAFDAGIDHPIVVSVLGSTEKGRFEDVEKLVWTTLEYLSNNDL